jgi:hypothetical protein
VFVKGGSCVEMIYMALFCFIFVFVFVFIFAIRNSISIFLKVER